MTKTSQWIRGVSLAHLLAVPLHAQWTTGQLAEPRYSHDSVATSLALYVASGWTTSAPCQIEMIEHASGQVTTFPMSQWRIDLATATAGGFVLFAGGRSQCPQVTCSSAVVDVFHEPSVTWAQDTLPVPVASATGGAIGNKVVIAGGFELGAPQRGLAQILDIATWSWTVVELGPIPRFLPAVVNDERWLCIVGGGLAGAEQFVDIYDSWADTWDQVEIPAPAAAPVVAAMVDGRVYTGWGYQSASAPFLASRQLNVLDVEARTWSTALLPRQRHFPYVSSVGPYVVATNGDWLGAHLSTADVYDTLTSEWHHFDLADDASRRSIAKDESRGAVFVSGGDTSQTAQGLIDRIDVFQISASLGQAFCGPAQINSTGLPARIAAVGLDVAAEEFLTVYVEDAPAGQLGLFLASSQSAPPFVPIGARGALCLGAPVARLGYSVRAVSSDGVLATSLRLHAAPFPAPLSALVGARWHFQAWFRDSYSGQPTSNFSDALAIDFR
jgi:hypothetical protein